jgi:hypothetical protein
MGLFHYAVKIRAQAGLTLYYGVTLKALLEENRFAGVSIARSRSLIRRALGRTHRKKAKYSDSRQQQHEYAAHWNPQD